MHLPLLSVLGFVLSTASNVSAQTPLTSRRFASPTDLPFKVDTSSGPRGPQAGYNICNDTTEGPTSLCQTIYLNGIEDFCLWGPQRAGDVLGNVQSELVGYCAVPGHGTRVMPRGTITGVQFLKTPDFIQVAGYFNQSNLNMVNGDPGGQQDPTGGDQRGNPIAGVVFSDAWGDVGSYTQVVHWVNPIGSDSFCFKACDPSRPNAARFCTSVYDRLGCMFNVPNEAKTDVYEACDADSGEIPGVFTTNGRVATYTQPISDPITALPYAPVMPKSSNCVTYESAKLFTTRLPRATSAGSSDSITNAPTPTGSDASPPPSGAALKAEMGGFFATLLSALLLL